jgi:tRNA threonylcarbamoyladenosine biosynthesis protein TsaB
MSGPSSTPFGWTLALELSNPTSGEGDSASPGDASSIALGRVWGAGGPGARCELVWTERVAPAMARGTEDDLFPAIERAMGRVGIGTGDLRGGRIAVSVGPGGYTGLRVACAAAKSLAEATGAGCVGVPTALVALRGRRGVAAGSGRTAVALASKSESAWVFVDGWQDPTAARFVSAATAGALVAEHGVGVLLADGHLPGAIRSACEGAGVAVEPIRLCAGACLEESAQLPEIDGALLVPVYAREPDAVTLWKGRKA